MPIFRYNTRAEDPRYLPSADWNALSEWAKLGPGSKVLDAGCGQFARDYIALHGMGCEVYGMDKRISSIRKAKAKLRKEGIPERLVKGDIKELPFFGEKFDFVYANAIPASGTEDGWKDVFRVLKKGGKAYITLIQEASHLKKGRPERFDFSYGTEEIMRWFQAGNESYKIEFEKVQPRPSTEETSIGARETKKLLARIEKL